MTASWKGGFRTGSDWHSYCFYLPDHTHSVFKCVCFTILTPPPPHWTAVIWLRTHLSVTVTWSGWPTTCAPTLSRPAGPAAPALAALPTNASGRSRARNFVVLVSQIFQFRCLPPCFYFRLDVCPCSPLSCSSSPAGSGSFHSVMSNYSSQKVLFGLYFFYPIFFFFNPAPQSIAVQMNQGLREEGLFAVSPFPQ